MTARNSSVPLRVGSAKQEGRRPGGVATSVVAGGMPQNTESDFDTVVWRGLRSGTSSIAPLGPRRCAELAVQLRERRSFARASRRTVALKTHRGVEQPGSSRGS